MKKDDEAGGFQAVPSLLIPSAVLCYPLNGRTAILPLPSAYPRPLPLPLTDYQNLYATLDKSTALQEARIFNETPIRPSKCCLTLSKVLYLLYNGEHLQPNEATDLFFSVT